MHVVNIVSVNPGKCVMSILINGLSSNQSYFHAVAAKCKSWCAYNKLVGRV